MDTNVGDDAMDIDAPFRELAGEGKPRKRARWQQQQQEERGMTPYNPFAVHPSQTWDDRAIDRFLTVKKPLDAEEGEIWLSDPDFAETFSLTPLNKVEQIRFIKKFRRIQMLSPGELSANIVKTRQDRYMAELLSQKGRKDVVEGGNLSEREMFITSSHKEEQTLRTPGQQQPRGFLPSLLPSLFR
jgi:hypothetical protein